MALEKVIDVPITGPPVGKLPVLSHSCDVSGLRLSALAPGALELRLATTSYMVDVNLGHVDNIWSLNSDRLIEGKVYPETVAWFPPNAEVRLKVQNEQWGLVIEIDTDRASQIEAEALDGRDLPPEFHDYSYDPVSALLARQLISHLRHYEIDRLFVEGLGLSITSRALGVADGYLTPKGQLGHSASDPRLQRATEYIHTHLGSSLSVGEIAGVATMSPSHFARCFKRAFGQPVWKYVESHRCERAKDMLLSTPFPISQVAYACGFSSQAHLTDSMRRRFGATPGQIRSTK